MEKYEIISTGIGSLCVFAGGFTGIFFLIRKTIGNSTAWTIFGISLVAGIFFVSGKKVTEISLPLLGQIKIAAEEAKNKIMEIEEIAQNIKKLKEESEEITGDIKKLKEESSANINSIKCDIISDKIKAKESTVKTLQRLIDTDNSTQYKDLHLDPEKTKETERKLDRAKKELDALNEEREKCKRN